MGHNRSIIMCFGRKMCCRLERLSRRLAVLSRLNHACLSCCKTAVLQCMAVVTEYRLSRLRLNLLSLVPLKFSGSQLGSQADANSLG